MSLNDLKPPSNDLCDYGKLLFAYLSSILGAFENVAADSLNGYELEVIFSTSVNSFYSSNLVSFLYCSSRSFLLIIGFYSIRSSMMICFELALEV